MPETTQHFMCVNCQDATSVVKKVKVELLQFVCCWCGKLKFGNNVSNIPYQTCKGGKHA